MKTTKYKTGRSQAPTKIKQVSSEAAAVHEILADSGAILHLLRVTNDTATAGWVQIFDATAAPQAGDTPIDRFPLPADGTVEIGDLVGEKGLVVAISTTRGTFTASANEAWFLAKIED